jgi:predicted NodU family carbamoyl transferase
VFEGSASVNILGLVYTSHDAGLALLSDGKPRIILEEERFNRIKHTLKYPRLAMDDVFGAHSDLKLSDVDVITAPWDQARIRRSIFNAVTAQMPASFNLLRNAAHPTPQHGAFKFAVPLAAWTVGPIRRQVWPYGDAAYRPGWPSRVACSDFLCVAV